MTQGWRNRVAVDKSTLTQTVPRDALRHGHAHGHGVVHESELDVRCTVEKFFYLSPDKDWNEVDVLIHVLLRVDDENGSPT